MLLLTKPSNSSSWDAGMQDPFTTAREEEGALCDGHFLSGVRDETSWVSLCARMEIP